MNPYKELGKVALRYLLSELWRASEPSAEQREEEQRRREAERKREEEQRRQQRRHEEEQRRREAEQRRVQSAKLKRRLTVGVIVSIILAAVVLATAAVGNWSAGITIAAVISVAGVTIFVTLLSARFLLSELYYASLRNFYYRPGIYVPLTALAAIGTTLATASGFAYLLVQVLLAGGSTGFGPTGFIVFLLIFLLVVAYIFVGGPTISHIFTRSFAPTITLPSPIYGDLGGPRVPPRQEPRPASRQEPRPAPRQRRRRPHQERTPQEAPRVLRHLQEIPAGKILVGAILMVSVTTVGWYLLSSIGIYGQEGWLLRGLGLIVGLGLNTAGIILLPLTVSVCVYAIFGPGFIGMDKETLHTVLAAIASGFFPYLEKKSASASVVIAIIAVPVCSYVSFGSGFDDSVTNITDVVLGVNLIVIVKYLQS